uniref:2-oxo acid dehydrogenase subunit E2 n=1 Tax=Hydrogenophaga sp. TaxID=1904254 RepID=UPI00286EA020
MAIVEVKVPQLSESVAEATLLQWKKKVGDAVTVDEILIDIETDKVVLECPAPSSGVLVEILQGDGATVAADQLIAKIDTAAVAGAAAPAAAPAAAAAPAPVAAAPAAAAAASTSKAGVAMPAAAKLMADNGMAAGSVAGTGKDGRVTKGDVLAAAAAPKAVAAPVAIPTGAPTKVLPQVAMVAPDLGDRPEERVPMTRLRARVAERLLQSQSTNAILTTFNEINMAPVMEMRKRMQERFEKEHGVKLGFMSFFVKAAVHALKKFPILNASVDGNDIVYHGYFDIGIAVG